LKNIPPHEIDKKMTGCDKADKNWVNLRIKKYYLIALGYLG
jgi:hypothetical protein